MDNDSKHGRPLNNLISRMPEFDKFSAKGAPRWTLPMAAAWFIWRDLAAVDDQWKIVMGQWRPTFDPPMFILNHHRRQPGTLACVFEQAGFADGRRPYVWLEEIRDPPVSLTRTPYDRLRYALQSGRLRAAVVRPSSDRKTLNEEEVFKDDWGDFDNLADPSFTDDAPCHAWSDSKECAIVVSREAAMAAETVISAAEASGTVWDLEQAVGWIAYRNDQSFRSLGPVDLRPPTFFDRRYARDHLEPAPFETLTSGLLKGSITAYLHGIALTQADVIRMLSENEGLWGQEDLIFLREEIQNVWQRRAENVRQGTALQEKRAGAALISFLKENPDATKDESKDWLNRQGYKIGSKGFGRIWKDARKDPSVGPAKPGSRRRAKRLTTESPPAETTS